MWRYQPGPTEFGDVSWACHMACENFTKWRVLPADLPHVPLADAPESWVRGRGGEDGGGKAFGAFFFFFDISFMFEYMFRT